jgi:hypothetical protein
MNDRVKGDGTTVPVIRENRFTAADWALFGLLLLFLVFLFREALFNEQALLSFDTRLWPPFSAHAPAGIEARAADAIHPDLPCWMMPERLISVAMMREGTPPLWTPYTLAGMPLLASLAFPVFYPVNLLLHGILDVDPLKALGYQTLINLALACLGMMLFLRSLGLGRVPRFLGALCLGASAWYLTHVYIPIFLNAAAWIPFMFWAGERLVQDRRTMTSTLMLALAAGASSLGGFPQITILGLYGVFIWILLRIVFRKGEGRLLSLPRLKPPGLFLAGTVLGMGLSLVQLLPAMEFKDHSLRDQDYPIAHYKEGAFQPVSLVGQIAPGFFGHPVDPEGGGGFQDRIEDFLTYRLFLDYDVQNNFMENAIYIGVIPFLLALAAIMTVRRSAVLILAFLALLSLLVTLSTPLMDLCYLLLPGFSVGSPKRVFIIYTFALSGLAAFGMEQFLEGENRVFKRTASAVLIVLGLSGIFALTLGFPSLTTLLGESWKERAAALKTGVPDADELAAVFIYLRKLAWPVVLSLLLFGFAQLVTRPGIRNMLPAILVLGFAIADAGHFGRAFITFQDHAGQYPPTATTRFLQEAGEETSPFRVASFGASEILVANLAAVHGIQNVGGISGLIHRRYGELVHALEPETIDMRDPRVIGAFRSPRSLTSPLIDLLGVRYIAVGNVEDAALMEEASFRLAFRNDEEGIGLFENLEVLPRCFAVTRCEITDRTKALARVADRTFDPSACAVLEEPLPADFTPAPDRSGRTPTIRIKSYEPLRIEVEADMQGAQGILVLTDTFLPGWKAFVDEAPADIYCADYAFRGVPLGKGKHDVLFRYEPSSRTLGSLGSALCLAILICWGILLGWKAIAARRTA